MADTYFYPGNANSFVPMAIAALQSNYSQNPDSFKIRGYATVANVPQSSGYYILHDPNEETRIVYNDGRDMLWQDGAYPSVNFIKGQDYQQFLTTRYSKMFTIGDIAQQNTNPLWSLICVDHSDTAAPSIDDLENEQYA